MSAPRTDPAAIHAAARVAALFLLAAAGTSCAAIAWRGAGPGALAAWAAAIAAAVVAGELAAPAAGGVHRTWRARGRTAASIAYATAVFLAAMLVAGAPTPHLLAQVTLLLAVAMAATAALAGAMDDPMLAVTNAYALAALAALRGGTPAAVAALAVPLAHAAFLVHDHAARTLGAFGARRGPGMADVWRAAAPAVALPLAALGVWLAAFPPRAYGGIRWDADAEGAATPAAAWRLFALIAFAGTAGVYIASQLLRRRRTRGAPIEEVIDAAVVDEETAPPAEAASGPVDPGPRGRVVRAYLQFLARAARLGYVRRPDWTPREFAGALRTPAAPLDRLTGVFMDARYGAHAPTDAEAEAAESAAGEVMADLGRRRRAGRGGGGGR